MRALPCIALCTALAGAALPAQAARPLVTEDSDALARGDCELEGYGTRITSRDGDPLNGWVTQLGCGLGASTQLAAAYGRTRQSGDRSDVATLSGKTQLAVRGDDRPGLALAYCLSGGRREGDSFQTESGALTLAASHAVGGGSLHANIGWNRNRPAHHSSTTWGVAAESAIAAGLDVVGELYGDDRTRPWANVGVRWAASESIGLNASYGVQLEASRIRVLTIGAKLAF